MHFAQNYFLCFMKQFLELSKLENEFSLILIQSLFMSLPFISNVILMLVYPKNSTGFISCFFPFNLSFLVTFIMSQNQISISNIEGLVGIEFVNVIKNIFMITNDKEQLKFFDLFINYSLWVVLFFYCLSQVIGKKRSQLDKGELIKVDLRNVGRFISPFVYHNQPLVQIVMCPEPKPIDFAEIDFLYFNSFFRMFFNILTCFSEIIFDNIFITEVGSDYIHLIPTPVKNVLSPMLVCLLLCVGLKFTLYATISAFIASFVLGILLFSIRNSNVSKKIFTGYNFSVCGVFYLLLFKILSNIEIGNFMVKNILYSLQMSIPLLLITYRNCKTKIESVQYKGCAFAFVISSILSNVFYMTSEIVLKNSISFGLLQIIEFFLLFWPIFTTKLNSDIVRKENGIVILVLGVVYILLISNINK